MAEKEWFCNSCGRKLQLGPSPRKEWGYFSQKDLEVHEFLLCEQCYDEMIGKFAIPVKKSQKIEVLQEGKSFS